MSFYDGSYTEAGVVTKTTTHIVCPDCGKPDADIDFAKGKEIEALWFCGNCGAQYGVKSTKDGKFYTHRTTARTDPSIVILRNGRIVLVLKGMKFNGHASGSPNNDDYFYNEHTCPTNYMKNVKAVIELPNKEQRQADTDPHGVFKYVATLPWDDALDRCDNDAWLRMNILPHIKS